MLRNSRNGFLNVKVLRNSLDFVKMLLFLPIIFPVFPRGMAKIFPGERGAQILKFPGIPRGPPLESLECLFHLLPKVLPFCPFRINF